MSQFSNNVRVFFMVILGIIVSTKVTYELIILMITIISEF